MMLSMRTTVTLDPDVETLLREEMQQGNRSFKQTLNEAVRRGLRGSSAPIEDRFTVEARPLRLRRGIDPGTLRDLDDELEIEEFQRKTRALERLVP
jgi:hypothetical protein